MPILPLDHPEPFAATLGVMLYPGTDELERRKAASFQTLWLPEPIRRATADGHHISAETAFHLVMQAGERLHDLDERYWQAIATGEVLTALFALYNTDPALASWNHAVTLVERAASRVRARGSRTALWHARSRFLPVAHLWAAWCIRKETFETRTEVGYDGYADFQFFLAESEIIRDWGQYWSPPQRNAKPPLPSDVWHPPDGWQPPKREPGYPPTGQIPILKLPVHVQAGLRHAGRPPQG